MARGRGRELGKEERSDGEEGSDPDEFFRRFPGGFLFFPVVTSSGGGSGLQTIRSKIFTATPADSAATGVAWNQRGKGWGGPGGRMGKVAELQTRGMAAAWSRKPINPYVCLSIYDLQSPTPLHLHLASLSLSLSLSLARARARELRSRSLRPFRLVLSPNIAGTGDISLVAPTFTRHLPLPLSY